MPYLINYLGNKNYKIKKGAVSTNITMLLKF